MPLVTFHCPVAMAACRPFRFTSARLLGGTRRSDTSSATADVPHPDVAPRADVASRAPPPPLPRGWRQLGGLLTAEQLSEQQGASVGGQGGRRRLGSEGTGAAEVLGDGMQSGSTAQDGVGDR